MYKIEYVGIEENSKYEEIISKVLEKCFEIEGIPSKKLMVSIMFTNPENIRKLNKEYRGIDRATDVLSFPMFEKNEIEQIINEKKWGYDDILGDMVISIEQVKLQAEEYGHSFERELSYMVVHSFYHLMGYDHMEEEDKKKMREKEEFVLNEMNILR